MTAPFEPGDVLVISSSAGNGRRYTVRESNLHRTVLAGQRGAHRVLVLCGGFGPVGVLRGARGHINEDDGERKRGRPCTVDEVIRTGWAADALASAEFHAQGNPSAEVMEVVRDSYPVAVGRTGARDALIQILGNDEIRTWDHAMHEVVRLRVREMWRKGSKIAEISAATGWPHDDVAQAVDNIPPPLSFRPMCRARLLNLLASESGDDVAAWVLDRLVSVVYRTHDPRAAEMIEALRLYQRASEMIDG